MIVYVVLEDDTRNYYPATCVVGVFSTEGRAEKEIERLEQQNRYENGTDARHFSWWCQDYEVED